MSRALEELQEAFALPPNHVTIRIADYEDKINCEEAEAKRSREKTLILSEAPTHERRRYFAQVPPPSDNRIEATMESLLTAFATIGERDQLHSLLKGVYVLWSKGDSTNRIFSEVKRFLSITLGTPASEKGPRPHLPPKPKGPRPGIPLFDEYKAKKLFLESLENPVELNLLQSELGAEVGAEVGALVIKNCRKMLNLWVAQVEAIEYYKDNYCRKSKPQAPKTQEPKPKTSFKKK